MNVSKDELQGKHCGALSLKCRKSGNTDDDTYSILKSNWAFKNPETDFAQRLCGDMFGLQKTHCSFTSTNYLD